MYVRSKLDREVKDRYEMKIGAKNRDTGDFIEEETTVSWVTSSEKGNRLGNGLGYGEDQGSTNRQV